MITFQSIRHHSAPLFYELKLLDVFKEYRYLVGIFIYDLMNNNLPHKASYYFSHIDHTYDTRKKEMCNCKPKAVRTELGKRAITYSGVKIWNNLSTELRTSSRKKICKVFKMNLLEEYT